MSTQSEQIVFNAQNFSLILAFSKVNKVFAILTTRRRYKSAKVQKKKKKKMQSSKELKSFTEAMSDMSKKIGKKKDSKSFIVD